MTIIDALIQLRNDLRLWISNNLNTKVNTKMGSKYSNTYLIVNKEGNIDTATFDNIDKSIKQEMASLTPEQIGITYGTADLTEGKSALPTGHFYFVIEE